MLWITLCATHPGCPETLALLGCGKGCPVSRQFFVLNEINNLAGIREIAMVRRNRAIQSFDQINFWG